MVGSIGDRSLSPPVIAIAAGAAALNAVFVRRSAFHVDGRVVFSLGEDAMVSMRYAHNLAEGAGLTWNAGPDPVEGYSNLLWTLWMAAVHLVGFPEPSVSAVVMASGAALLVGNLVLVRAVTRALAPGAERVQVTAMMLVALDFPLMFWTLRGFEVGLIAFLMSASLLLALRLRGRPTGRDQALLAAALAAGVLTRDDFAVFAAIVAVAVIAWAPAGTRGRAAAAVIGGPLAAVAGHELFRLAYYGELLPNTYYLKLRGVGLGARLERGVASLASAGLTQLYAPAALAAVALASARGPARAGAWLLAATFAGQCAYSAYVGGDSFEIGLANRFVAPAAPALLILAALGLDAVLGPARSGSRRTLLALAGAFLLGAAAVVWSLVGDPITGRLSEWLLVPVRGSVSQAVLLAMLGLLCLARLRLPRGGSALFAAGSAVLLLAVSGAALWGWARDNAPYRGLDRRLVGYGFALRQTTSPKASIAVTAAGATPYFSHRRSIDLLGRVDAVIARTPSRSNSFWPGHNKWSYQHSVGKLRPDVIASVWGLTPGEERLLAGYGYEPLPHGRDLRIVGAVYVRTDSTRVNHDALDRHVYELFPPR
jgi:hypothetical protein